ncbi:MAG: hypothetical protein ACYC61_03415 [Isosphaeraceae bacterium]
MDQLIRSDEFDRERSTPIVAIPRRWALLQYFIPLIPLTPLTVLFWLDPQMTRRRQAPGLDGWIGWIAPFWLLILASAMGVVAAIWMGRTPAFAVFKDGIKVGTRRIAPWRSTWDPWSYGFYAWSEVSYCRWSPYRPGVLSVHVRAADQHPPVGRFVELPALLTRVPPEVFFYRVPETLHAAVESAIRTYGNWVD